ncbi:MAG: DKNYY domain-containing protein, partial [Saprospiraceae bacterium]
MKIAISIFIILCILYFVKGCQTGYVNNNDVWSWVTIDESHGKRLHWIEGIDQNSFEVLKNKNFALDQHQVYFKGRKINHASPDGFLPLTEDEYGYAKDSKHAFFN